MKILWFANASSNYSKAYSYYNNYNGCGWVESLEEIVANNEEIDLAVSFFHPTDYKKTLIGKTFYYPILKPTREQKPFSYLLNVWASDSIFEKNLILSMLSVIDDFRPDIIHIFGTEGLFNSIQKYTNIPVVIHLQGIINPCLNSFFPINHNKTSLKFSKYFILKNLFGLGKLSDYKRLIKQSVRETNNLKITKYVMGRTEWDNRIVRLYNSNVFYFHVDEVLRKDFYRPGGITKHDNKKISLISTLSSTIYKGIDVVLKTAKLLKTETNIDFEWNLIGISEQDKLLNYFISKTKIHPNSVNVNLLGIKNADEVASQLLKSDIFIHPSYIDNSPNSVCEAQIIGLPVIACNVGGLASLIEHKVSGILIPSNGIFELASWIIELSENKELRFEISSRAQNVARYRHDKQKIYLDLLNAYSVIMNHN